MNFRSGVISPKSINLLAKVGYNLAKVKPFGKTSYDLAKAGSFAKLYIIEKWLFSRYNRVSSRTKML